MALPKSVPNAAKSRNMFVLDATCPLVFKVHFEAVRHHEAGREVVLIGHAGHPEVVGTMGQLPDGAVHADRDGRRCRPPGTARPERLAFVTQTTLSVDDTAAIVAALKERFPEIVGPHKEDICYATTNRQAAVKAIAPRCDLVLVVGAPNSVEFAAPRRGRRTRRLPIGPSRPARRRHPLASGSSRWRHHRHHRGSLGAGSPRRRNPRSAWASATPSMSNS